MAKRVSPRLPATLRPATLPDDDLVDEAVLNGLLYEGLDLRSRQARLIDVEECRLVDTSLAGGRFDKLTLTDAVLDRCDLANVSLTHSALARTELTGCRATGLVLSGGLLRNVTLRECLADLSVLRFATF